MIFKTFFNALHFHETREIICQVSDVGHGPLVLTCWVIRGIFIL